MAQASPAPVQQLTVFLIDKSVTAFPEALMLPRSLDAFPLKRAFGDGTLFVKPNRRKVPKWVGYVTPGVTEDLGSIFTASSSAILILRVRGRLLAVSFGFGKWLLKPQVIVPDFGLRVTLNAVDPDNLRSVDVKTFQDLTLHTRRQSSKGSPLESFGLDPMQDILRAVTGEPSDKALAIRLTGADALSVAARVKLGDLTALGAKLIKLFTAKAYRERFEWVDHLRPVKDSELIDELDAELVHAVNVRDDVALQLGPPEPIRWDNVILFRYSTDRTTSFSDLNSADYFLTLRREATLATLKSHKVSAIRGEDDEIEAEWSIYATCLFESVRRQTRYVLSSGRWYAIKSSLADQVKDRLSTLIAGAPTLPNALDGETEDDYNGRVARDVKGITQMHKILAKGDGFGAPIELCDLLTDSDELVHVKVWAKSGTLSHMVAQGLVSAEAYLWEPSYRKDLSDKAKTEHGTAVARRLAAVPIAKDLTVVYALIIADRPNWPHHLPFFSQLHLTQAAERLRRAGFGVSLSRVVREGASSSATTKN